MSLDYVYDDGSKYGFSYQEMREQYHQYKAMTDKQFFHRKNLIQALHFACFVAFIKELPNSATLSDQGLIHQLVHHLHIGDEPYVKSERRKTRQQFDDLLELK